MSLRSRLPWSRGQVAASNDQITWAAGGPASGGHQWRVFKAFRFTCPPKLSISGFPCMPFFVPAQFLRMSTVRPANASGFAIQVEGEVENLRGEGDAAASRLLSLPAAPIASTVAVDLFIQKENIRLDGYHWDFVVAKIVRILVTGMCGGQWFCELMKRNTLIL